MWRNWTLRHCLYWSSALEPHMLWECKNGAASLNNRLAVPQMLNTEVPYDPMTPLLAICLREMKTYVHMKTCVQTFTAALFITAQNGNNQMFIK